MLTPSGAFSGATLVGKFYNMFCGALNRKMKSEKAISSQFGRKLSENVSNLAPKPQNFGLRKPSTFSFFRYFFWKNLCGHHGTFGAPKFDAHIIFCNFFLWCEFRINCKTHSFHFFTITRFFVIFLYIMQFSLTDNGLWRC